MRNGAESPFEYASPTKSHEDEIALQNYLTVYPVVTADSQNEVLYRRQTAAQNAMNMDTSYRFYMVNGFIVRYEKSV